MKKTITLLLIITLCNLSYSQCWKKIASGSEFTLGIKPDGTLWTWGWNGYGVLGNGTTSHVNTPTKIGVSTNWETIAGGLYHSAAIKADGTLWTWGKNSNGQLGNGSLVDSYVPVQIGVSAWKEVSLGINHSLGIKNDGSLWGWGDNGFAQFGNGTGSSGSSTPIQIGVDLNWKSVVAGFEQSYATKTDGTLWFWGKNFYPNPATTVPTQVGIASDWTTISGCYSHIIGLKTDNTLWALGFNFYGQLGDGTNITVLSPVLSQIGVDTWLNISAGYYHSLAVKSDHTLWAWGRNTFYTLGDGTTTESHIPIQIGTDTNWLFVSGDETNSFALKTDGSLYSWGYNFHGQMGDGTNVDKSTPTFISCSTSSSITSDSSLKYNESIVLYPNPASGYININKSKFNHIEKVTITDFLGREVIHITGNEVNIEVDALTPGVYIVSVYNDGIRYQEKFIKK